MAEHGELERPAVDRAAGEEFLRSAFEVLLEEAVRRGTDAAQKVGAWGGETGGGGLSAGG